MGSEHFHLDIVISCRSTFFFAIIISNIYMIFQFLNFFVYFEKNFIFLAEDLSLTT